MRPDQLWRPEEDEILRSMWGKRRPDGEMMYYAIDIACKLKNRSRNSVISRASRLGLATLKRIPKPKKPKLKRARARHRYLWGPEYLEPKPLPRPQIPEPPSLALTIIERKADQCAYIAGDDGLCCGQQTYSGGSWCEFHYRIVYRRIDEEARSRSPLCEAAE